jgi:hypothetical protein
MTVPADGAVVKLGSDEGVPAVGEAYEPVRHILSDPLVRKKLCVAEEYVVKVLLLYTTEILPFAWSEPENYSFHYHHNNIGVL